MKVFILRGLPGSGKTKFAIENLEGSAMMPPTTVFVSADHFFEAMGPYLEVFDPKLLPEAHKACKRDFIQALNAKTPIVVVDNTNVSAYEVGFYNEYSLLCGYKPVVVNILADPFDCFKRNTHGVPLKTILDMHKRMEDLPPWVNQQYARFNGSWEIF